MFRPHKADALYISESVHYFRAFEEALQNAGLRVVTHVDSVPEAEEAIRQRNFDAIILGMLLREDYTGTAPFSGLGLLQIIKASKQNRDTPIIIQSVVDYSRN